MAPASRGDRSGKAWQQVVGSATPEQLEGLADSGAVAIEARGTFCPEPVIRMQRAAADLPVGAVAMLLADDLGVEVDIPAWCISTGNEYLGLLRRTKHYKVFVRKR